MFCVYGMMHQQFPEPGAEAFDLGHVGFSLFLHGFAHFGLAFSVLGTTKSEAEYRGVLPIPGSFYGRRKSPFCVVKCSKIRDIFKYSMFNNFHGHFVSTEDVPTFKIHATLATSIFIADQCDHHFPIHFPIQSSYFPHIMDNISPYFPNTCPVCFPDFSGQGSAPLASIASQSGDPGEK